MNLTTVILICLLIVSIIVICWIILSFLDVDYKTKKDIQDLTWIFVNQKQKDQTDLNLISKDQYNKIVDNYLKNQSSESYIYDILTLKVSNDLKDLKNSNPQVQLNTDAIGLLNFAEYVNKSMNQGMCDASKNFNIAQDIRKLVWGCTD